MTDIESSVDGVDNFDQTAKGAFRVVLNLILNECLTVMVSFDSPSVKHVMALRVISERQH